MQRPKGYNNWSNMLQRCRNPQNPNFANYGGRGIIVCERWLSFENFISDMGEPPTAKHQIDRVDNNGNYEPDNCQWATQTENLRNNCHVHRVEAFGETKAMSAWAEDKRCMVSYTTLRKRLRDGWAAEAAISTVKQTPHYRKRLVNATVDNLQRDSC